MVLVHGSNGSTDSDHHANDGDCHDDEEEKDQVDAIVSVHTGSCNHA